MKPVIAIALLSIAVFQSGASAQDLRSKSADITTFAAKEGSGQLIRFNDFQFVLPEGYVLESKLATSFQASKPAKIVYIDSDSAVLRRSDQSTAPLFLDRPRIKYNTSTGQVDIYADRVITSQPLHAPKIIGSTSTLAAPTRKSVIANGTEALDVALSCGTNGHVEFDGVDQGADEVCSGTTLVSCRGGLHLVLNATTCA